MYHIVIMLFVIFLVVVAHYGGFPVPWRSFFDRAAYFHRKARIEYQNGNHKKSQALHGKAQVLREKGERLNSR
jgi:hypothetical protein